MFELKTQKIEDPIAGEEKREKIRNMAYKDLTEILDIERRSFASPWTRAMFLNSIGADICKNLVCELDGIIIGYIMLYSVVDEAHITNFAVKPGFRRRGLGSRLLSYVLDYYKKRGVKYYFLEVREKNYDAINLYKRYNFKIVGRRRRYYTETNEDALVMRLELEE